MRKRIHKLIDGLNILEAYSNEVMVENHQIVAGPVIEDKISEDDRKLLEEMGWAFEEGEGWTLWLGSW